MHSIQHLVLKLWTVVAALQLLLVALVIGILEVWNRGAAAPTNPSGGEELASPRPIFGSAVLIVGGLLVSWWLTWWILRRLLSPLDAIARAANRMAAGESLDLQPLHTSHDFSAVTQGLQAVWKRLGDEQQLSRTESDRLTAVLDHMVEGVIAVDAQRHVQFANRAAGLLLKFDTATAANGALHDLVRNYSLQRLVDEAVASGSRKRLELAEGQQPRRVLSVSATPLPGLAGAGATLVLTDISELRRLESLRQDFVANVSHELKTPLSSIKAYAETLLNGALYDERTNVKFLKGIDEQTDRLHRLIMDMLSLARIESGRKAFEMTRVTVGHVVETCVADYTASAQGRGVELLALPAVSNVLVWADEEGLREIIGNLIDNAIKYTPSGGHVRVECRSEGNQAIIEVSDTGIGIPTEHLSRLFERFYRVDKARSRELGGTGLGLSIVKHLCQVFRGNVTVSSTPNQGSTFRVTLPLAPRENGSQPGATGEANIAIEPPGERAESATEPTSEAPR